MPVRCLQGDYGLKVTARNADGEDLMCIQVNFTLTPPTATETLEAAEAVVAGGKGEGEGGSEIVRAGLVVVGAGQGRGRVGDVARALRALMPDKA